MTQRAQERTAEAWLSLLRTLTAATPRWIVMKGVESALSGTGDVDSIGPLQVWQLIEGEFRSWAAAHGFGPVVACPHAPFVLHLVALAPDRSQFYELDVNRRKVFLGSTLFRPEDVEPFAVMDERGYRRLRPGAEGLLKLVQNGMRRDGTPDPDGLRVKGVERLVRLDPQGFADAAALFGLARGAAARLAGAVAEGGWDRPAALRLEAWCVLRGVREPSAAAARVRFRYRKRRCPVLRAVFENGRVPIGGPEAWLAEVSATHAID